MVEIILGIVVCISSILLAVTVINSRFQLAIVKIDKAEEDIDMYLGKKKELLSSSREIVSKELKLEHFLPELDENFDNINHFEENDILKNAYTELFKTVDDNEKLLKSESLSSILTGLSENDENMLGAIKFYNDNVIEFNKLVASFPSRAVAFFKRYKRKEFFNDEKREMFEILNEG